MQRGVLEATIIFNAKIKKIIEFKFLIFFRNSWSLYCLFYLLITQIINFKGRSKLLCTFLLEDKSEKTTSVNF